MRLLTILVFTAVVVAVIDAKAARLPRKETEEVAPNANPNSSQNVDSNGDLSENVQPQPESQSETNENHQKSKRARGPAGAFVNY